MVVPLELLPRQELLLRDERLRLRPEERRRRQHDPAAALRRPAKAATGGRRRHTAGLHSRSVEERMQPFHLRAVEWGGGAAVSAADFYAFQQRQGAWGRDAA